MSLDHGILNVPLSKRGDINAQLDRYKIDQARLERAKSAERIKASIEAKATAKALLSEHIEVIVEHYKAKYTPTEIRRLLNGWAKWEPKKLIWFIEKYLEEQP